MDFRKISTLIFESFSVEPSIFNQNKFFSETWIIFESVVNQKKLRENAGYNTLELYNILAQLGFAISKTKLGIEYKTALYTNFLTSYWTT